MSVIPCEFTSNPSGPAHRSGQRRKLRVPVLILAARLVAVAMVTVAPWLFGSVQAHVQAWLMAGMIVALACLLAEQIIHRPPKGAVSIVVVPLLCALVLGGLQLIPLGGNVASLLSPTGVELRRDLQSEEAASDLGINESLGMETVPRRQPLSLYPAATRQNLALLTLCAGMFLLGSGLFGTSRAPVWLFVPVAANGAVLAFWGLAQKLSWNGKLYGCVPLTNGGTPFGPFVNRNNAGGFLILCLAGAVSMIVWAVSRGGRREYAEAPAWATAGRSLPARLGRRALEPFSRLSASAVTALALAACIIGGICCSLSRGSLVATIVAVLVTALVLSCAKRRDFRVGWLLAAALAGLLLVSWVGMLDSTRTRLGTLLDQKTLTEGRIPHWQAGLKTAGDFRRFGSGLGTYRYVYPAYQRHFDDAWFLHAENQYLEAFVEGGVMGLALLLTAMGLMGAAAWRAVRHAPDPMTFALGVGGVFALTGLAIHAFFDFGLSIPANMMLCALWCGCVSGRAARLKSESGVATEKTRGHVVKRVLFGSRFALAGLTAGVLAAGVWGCLEIRRVAAVKTALKETELDAGPRAVTPGDLAERIDRLAAAISGRPDDAEAQQRMAELQIHLYRIYALEQLRREEQLYGLRQTPGNETVASRDARLWEIASVMTIHGRVHEFARNGLRPELDELRSVAVVRDHLRPAARHLVLSRRACPLLPAVHMRLAQLCGLMTEPAGYRIHLDRLRRLTPSDPDMQFMHGLLRFHAGQPELAYAGWKRSLGLTPRYLDDVLYLAGDRLAAPGTIEKLLPDSPKLLARLAEEEFPADADRETHRLLLRRAGQLAEQAGLPDDEHYYLRGLIGASNGEYGRAIEDYSRAVRLRPRELAWRYRLARLFQHQGMLAEAHYHARRCARMAPQNRTYRDLLNEIHRARLAPARASRPESPIEGVHRSVGA